MKRYTVKEVSQLSKVSVRTLHFYDEIGLLKPASIGDNGYRYYEREQLLRLQQILFYRELGFALDEIQKILASSDFDKIDALKSHREKLQRDAGRIEELMQTIDNTIADLKGERPMKDDELYKGFAPEKQVEYEQYLVNRYGSEAEKHIRESKEKMKGWTREDFAKVKAEADTVTHGIAQLIDAGAKPGDPRVQDLVAQHYSWVCRFWTPNREAYIGLSQLYVEHPDFRKTYEAIHPKLTDFLVEAMKVYAEAKL